MLHSLLQIVPCYHTQKVRGMQGKGCACFKTSSTNITTRDFADALLLKRRGQLEVSEDSFINEESRYSDTPLVADVFEQVLSVERLLWE